MLSKLPEVAADGYGRGFNRRETVIRIRLTDGFESVDQHIDLGRLKADDFKIEVQLQFREHLELFSQQPLIP